LCWRHLVRDFQKILERGGDSPRIGWYLKCQAESLLMRWARGRDGTLDYFTFLVEFPAIQAQIRHWLTNGLSVSSSRTAATCRRLLAADPDLGRFASVPSLEPTNNRAERALRHPVIGRRNSHGTPSDGGSRFVERLLTVVETCRQQHRPAFDLLRDALMAYRTGQAAPSLLPAH
jgi:transposase